MSTESREHLSCLMDGEISRETGRFLVRRLGADQELCATWARYHLVRDCLRHHEGGLASESLSSRVRQAIERESRPQPAGQTAWLKPLVGMAVAASVALLAIVAVSPENPALQQAGDNPVAAEAAPAFTSPQSFAPAPVSQQASLAGGDNRMNAYLLRHLQATGSTGGKGFVTFVPIVITPVVAQPERDNPAAEPESSTSKGANDPSE
jgi:sigma-E factor negative regulatory protein RseA